MDGTPALERLLRRDRAITAAGLTVLCALAWFYIVTGAGMGQSAWSMTKLSLFPYALPEPMAGMAGMDMTGMAMRPTAWSLGVWALTIAMWWTMMVAMMTPSATPTIMLHARVHRHALAQGQTAGLAPTGVSARN